VSLGRAVPWNLQARDKLRSAGREEWGSDELGKCRATVMAELLGDIAGNTCKASVAYVAPRRLALSVCFIGVIVGRELSKGAPGLVSLAAQGPVFGDRGRVLVLTGLDVGVACRCVARQSCAREFAST
jgi:hypothetical protein